MFLSLWNRFQGFRPGGVTMPASRRATVAYVAAAAEQMPPGAGSRISLAGGMGWSTAVR